MQPKTVFLHCSRNVSDDGKPVPRIDPARGYCHAWGLTDKEVVLPKTPSSHTSIRRRMDSITSFSIALRPESGDEDAKAMVDEARTRLSDAINYYLDPKVKRAIQNYPLDFDLEHARRRLKLALASKASDRSGPKMLTKPGRDAFSLRGPMKGHQKVVENPATGLAPV